MCYIFRQIFPFHSELRKDKIATCLLLPPAVVLSPPTFWEACDQPEPGSFFPRMKDPGNEVVECSGIHFRRVLSGKEVPLRQRMLCQMIGITVICCYWQECSLGWWAGCFSRGGRIAVEYLAL